jgi:elongin-C
VEKVAEYMAYKTTYEKAGPKEDVPDFMERIPPEIALEL